MNEKSEKIIWEYLESGDWGNALKEARKLVKAAPSNIEYANLEKYTAKIESINFIFIHGEAKDKAKLPKQLEALAVAIPRLAELSSFKALLGVSQELSSNLVVEMVPESRPSLPSPVRPKTKSPIPGRILRPSGKTATVVTVIFAIVIVLFVNLISSAYVKTQPRPGVDTAVNAYIQSWLGLEALSAPVNTLLLGDSACNEDLAPGQIGDRLGGKVINLGNNVGTSLLSDAWMLKDYIERFGPPKNVILLRCPASFRVEHKIEYLSSAPLPWDYWDHYGLAPAWKGGEIPDLFVNKYFTLYSDSDILREKLIKPWEKSQNSLNIPQPSSSHNRGNDSATQIVMDISQQEPADYFSPFTVVPDADNALRFMCNLARSEHFQLYIVYQPEWDEAFNAGLRDDVLKAETEYLAGFIDPVYVHTVNDKAFVFSKDMLQSTEHLRPIAANIYTEAIINDIAAIQNQLTAQQALSLRLETATPQKITFNTGEEPVITIKASAGTSNTSGEVSCLLKPAGASDGEWVIRASSEPVIFTGNTSQEITLTLDHGEITTAGSYDLVVFMRQNVNGLSNETRVEISNFIEVK